MIVPASVSCVRFASERSRWVTMGSHELNVVIACPYPTPLERMAIEPLAASGPSAH